MDKIGTHGFLGTRLASEPAAAEAIAEADEKGSATRTMEYALGYTARVVIFACDASMKPLNH